MKIKSLMFGEMEFSEQDVIEFSQGIPGFPELNKFVIMANEALEPFQYLQAVEEPFVAFALVSPYLLDSQYQITLTEEDMNEIKAEDNSNLLVYVIVTIKERVNDSTANLLAPLIINPQKMLGKQVIQSKGNYSVKFPLVQKQEAALKG